MSTLLSINNYNYVRGGAEFVFLNHNQIFSDSGWDIVSFCMRHAKNETSQWEKYFVDEIELSEDYGLYGKAVKSVKAIYSREARTKLKHLISDTRPDVAHAHNIYHHISPSILSVLREHGIPSFLTLHDLKLACPAYRMISQNSICERCKGGAFHQAARNRCMHGSAALSAWVMTEAYVHKFLGSYEHVDQFVVPSRFYIDKFVEWGWSRDRFTYIPNFVDAETIDPCYQPGKDFLYFGRLSAEKGLGTLIQAAGKAGVGLQILGTGPEEDALKSLARQHNVTVDFAGFVSGDALFDRLRGSRAIILPSEWYENAPISLLEAYAAGKPVLGANIGGIPELITNDRGRVFESFSIDSLADTLIEFDGLDDGDIAAMGQAAREYVIAEHSRQSYLQRCQALYQGALQ